MTCAEALAVGLIDVEDINKMRKAFSISDLEQHIIGKTVTSLEYGPGTIISIQSELSAINVNFGGKTHAIAYPMGFINYLKFDDKQIENFLKVKIALYEATLEWGAAFNEPLFLYTLYVFRICQGKEDEAFKYLCRAAVEGNECAQDCILGSCSRRIENGLPVDDEIIKFAVDLYKKRAAEGDIWGPILLADYYYVTQNYKTAESYFLITAEDNELDDDLRGEAAAKLARMYLTGQYSTNIKQKIFRNYQLAKQYFEIATKCRYPCEADLVFVNRVLGIESKHNAMKKLAEKVINSNYTKSEIYMLILSDLRSEFADLWETLPKTSQVDLVSGCLVYCNLYALGETICEEIDFSAAILPIVKAAEVVFRKYLCQDYLEFLINHQVSPYAFPVSYPLIEHDNSNKTRKFVDKDSMTFTLGSIKHLIINKDTREVFPEFHAYAYSIMGESITSKNELNDYFKKLSQEMTQVTFDIRNPAAHSSIMPHWLAEICGNEIILVRKVLKEFIEKINH